MASSTSSWSEITAPPTAIEAGVENWTTVAVRAPVTAMPTTAAPSLNSATQPLDSTRDTAALPHR